jgi:hypothetical protein
MRKVLVFSLLLVAGLIGSQVLPALMGSSFGTASFILKLLTMLFLSFIMIHVGYEFEIDKSNLRQYVWDYAIAATAAAFPWIFVMLYFIYGISPPDQWSSGDLWRESALAGRFASPTSAGILFSMLAAAGLGLTWVFNKARILAIFDDLDTILLMIPLKIMMIGVRWQLMVIVVVMFGLLYLAWKYLKRWQIPNTWPWVLTYAAIITAACEAVYLGSKWLEPVVPVHLEVLLPAFVLGCIMAHKPGMDKPDDEALEGHQEGPDSPEEQRVSTIISACFMVLVGLSMPSLTDVNASKAAPATVMPADITAAPIAAIAEQPADSWQVIAFHVMVVTIISNLGKMFPLFCYRREAHWRERLALSIGMFPRGEVGAGVLVISLSYGIGGTILSVAMLSLALNLVLTGLFILAVKYLIATTPARAGSINGVRQV